MKSLPTKRPSRVIALIPALNEEESLPRVLADLPASVVDRVLVIDNGSTDRTADVARKLGAAVLTEPRRGYGRALQTGLAEIARSSADAEVILFLDADYSDYPERASDLVAPILAGEADFVLSSRLAGAGSAKSLPLHSRWGNRLACWLIRLRTGFRYTDLGPFRAIRRDLLLRLEMRDQSFGWTVEMQLKSAIAGARIQEVPLPYRARIGKSKITGTLWGSMRAGSMILWTVARHGFWSPSDRRFAAATQRRAA